MAVGLMRRQADRLAYAWRSYWKGPYTLSSLMAKAFSDGQAVSAGVSVSEQSALTYSAFWACVNTISTDVASLPLILYKRDEGGGKKRYTNSRTYQLLHDEPNPEMTSMTLRQATQAHALTWGGGYAEIERDRLDRPKYLWPITPDRVSPVRNVAGDVGYSVVQGSGKQPVVIEAANMLHIPGLGFDGLCGYSVVSMARESIGLGIATERFGGTFFGNGATFGGVISYKGPRPSELSDKNYRESLEAKHVGVNQAHKFLALYNEATYTRLGIPPNDAQFLETRLHQIEEMCRWFRMPPHKIQHLLRSTNNNIEHQSIEYYSDTLRPWLVRWEQEINRKLISPLERRFQFAEHMIEGVLRGDLASRYAAYAVGRQWGWLSADDVCEKENMNPLPNGIGKVYLLPLNMIPADRIGEMIDAQIKAKETPPQPKQLTPADEPKPDDTGRALDAIRAELVAVQERIEAATALAAAADADAVRWKDSSGVFEAEAATQRAQADELRQKASALEALRLEAQERLDRVTAERDAADAFAKEAVERHAETSKHHVEAVAAKEQAEAARAAVGAELVGARGVLAERETALREAQAKLAELDASVPVALATREADVARVTQERDAAQAAVSQAEQRAQVEADGRTVMVAALETEQAESLKRMTSVIAAHRGLIADAMGRMIRRETEKARRAQATPGKLRAWLETFYPAHEDICRAALLPAIRAHLAWKQSEDDPSAVTQAFVRAHIEESQRQLRLVLDSDPEDVPMTLETTLRQWELERADCLADVILRDEVEHVTRAV